jgi:hypothetical protein
MRSFIEVFHNSTSGALDHRRSVQSIVVVGRPSREGRRWMTSNLPQVASSNHLPAHSLEVDFGIVLARMLENLKSDPSELRNAAYELARIKLQKECWLRNPPLTVLEMRRALLALEVAIERVEAGQSRADALLLQPSNRLIESQEILPPEPMTRPHDPPKAADHAILAEPGSSRLKSTWLRGRAMSMLKAVATATLAVALFVILDRQFAFVRSPGETVAPVTQKTGELGSDPGSGAFSPVTRPQAPGVALPSVSPSRSSGLALPTVYGVYASNNGQLHELDVLPGRVPDQRVLISAAITKPGHTIFPDGKIVFVVFRRDLATNPPDRVAVRVIAKIAREMKVGQTGQMITTALDDVWVIRNKSYEFRVAPLSENPDMLVIQPENSDFVFPAGRHGLVLKGQAYDFSVAGPVMDPAYCLERLEGANGIFYSECRKP